MSGVLDENVVILKFDNSDFEKNTEKSMKSLEKLKSSFKDSTSGAEFEKVGRAANQINFSNLERSVDKLQKRFGLLGTIGTNVVNNITSSCISSARQIISAVPNQIIQGGWKRALNIEQAKFQIEGLGLVWDETSEKFKDGAKKIKDDVLNAVQGTAFGLDEAAKVASQFAASGMEAGKEMENSLKGIAGVAAMTGSSFEDIGRIFTTVAGNGRLMGDQLLQLSGRGINAAATLAQAMNVTEQEVREMVSKGQISFEMFYKAMNNAFGEHAKKANDTYTGSLANMKAALSRIGADVEAKKIENLKNIFNAMTPVIDQIHTLLGGVIDRINGLSTSVSNFAVKGLHSIEFALRPYVDTIKGTKSELSFMDHIYEQAYMKLSKKQKKATKGMIATQKEAKVAWDIIKGKYAPTTDDEKEARKERKAQIEALGLEYKKVQRYTNALIKAGLDEEACHIKVEGAVKKETDAKKKGTKESILFAKSYTGLKPMVVIVGGLTNAVKAAKEGFKALKNVAGIAFQALKVGLTPIINKAAVELLKFSNRLVETTKKYAIFAKAVSSKKFLESYEKLDPEMRKHAMKFRKHLESFAEITREYSTKAGNYISELFEKLRASGSLDKLRNSFIKLKDSIKAFAVEKFKLITPFFDKIRENAKDTFSVDNLAKRIDSLADKVNKFTDGLKTGESPLTKFLTLFTQFEGKVTGMNFAKFSLGKKGTDIKNSAFKGLLAVGKNLQDADVAGSFNKITDSVVKMTEAVNISQRKIDVKNGAKGVIGWLQGLDYNKLSTIGLKLSGMVGIFVTVKKLSDVANATVGMLGSISGFFRSLTGISNQVKANLKIEAFRTIAMSIAMIAGSIAILAMIPKDKVLTSAGVITTLMGVVVAIIALTNSSKFKAENMKAVGLSFAGMGAAMLSLAIACQKIGSMKTTDIIKAGLTITGFIGMFVATSHFAGEIQKSGKSFALMAAAIDMLVYAVSALAALKYSTILEGGSAIMLFMTEMAIAARIARDANPGGFVAMALAIDLLVPAIITLALIPPGMIIKGGIAVTGLMTALAVAANIAGRSQSNLKSMIAMTATVVAVATSLTVLSFLDPVRLSVAMVALVSSITAIAIASDIARQAVKGALAMSLVVSVITAAIITMIKMDIAKSVAAAAGLGVLIYTLSSSLIILGKLSWKEIGMGVLALDAIIADLILVMAAFGGLNKATGKIAEKGIKHFGTLLHAIGEALGQFAGGFILGMTSDLPQSGANLTEFIKNLQPFLKMVSEIKGGSLKGIHTLSETLRNLTGINFTQFHAQGNVENFGDDLQKLAVEFIKFSTVLGAIPDIAISKTDAIAEILKTMSKVANALPRQNGIAQEVTGSKDLSIFATQAGAALDAIGNFAIIVGSKKFPKGTSDKIDALADVIAKMAKVAKKIPPSDGFIQALSGNTTISEFAAFLESSVDPIQNFLKGVRGFKIGKKTHADIDSLCDVIIQMSKVAKKIPPSLGAEQLIKGNTTLPEFANMMNTMVRPIAAFLSRIQLLTKEDMAATDRIPAISKAIAWMAWCANKLPKTHGIKQAISGFPDLKQFAEQMEDFAPAFDSFMDSLKGTAVDDKQVKKIKNISKATNSVVEMANSLKTTGGWKGTIFGNRDLGSFSTDLETLGTGIYNFYSKTKDITPKTLTSVAKAVKVAVNNLTAITKISPEVNFGDLGESVKKFGDNIAKTVIEGMEDKTKAVGDAVNALVKSANKAVSDASVSDFEKAGEKAGKAFEAGIKERYDNAFKKGKKLSKKAYKGLKEGGSKENARRVGLGIADGFINGLKDKQKKQEIYAAAEELGKLAIQGQKDGSESNSPSKAAERVGGWMGKGLIIGMKSYERKAYKKGKSLAQQSILGQKEVLNEAIDEFSTPVITPVLDTSGIKYGFDRLSAGVSVNRAMNINPGSSYDRMATAMEKALKKQNSEPTVNNINVNVDGTENPEAFVNRFVDQFNLKMRTG